MKRDTRVPKRGRGEDGHISNQKTQIEYPTVMAPKEASEKQERKKGTKTSRPLEKGKTKRDVS